MRVKGKEPPSTADESSSTPPPPPTTTASSSQGTSNAPFSSMGYTGTTAPAAPPIYPNFLDFIDDSGDQDADDNESPMPPGFSEDDLFDMLTNSDFDWPPFQGGTGPQSRNGYPGAAPNGYGQYPQASGYQYPPYQYGNQYGYSGAYPQPPPYAQATAKTGTVPPPAVKQEHMDTSDDQPMSLVSSTAATTANSPINMTIQEVPAQMQQDPLKTIATKVGITSAESDNSHDSIQAIGSVPPDQQGMAAHSPTPSTSGVGLLNTVSQLPGSTSPHSHGGLSPQSLSPTPSMQSRSSAKQRNTKSSGIRKAGARAAPVTASAPVSPSSNNANNVKNKLISAKVEVDETALIEDAKSRPIRHRKEPDIEDTKTRSVRNAINARVNRQKHKLYVETLEQDIDDLKEVNTKLEEKNQDLQNQMAEMQKNIQYLENVIKNDSALSRVIGGLRDVEDVRLSSSIGRKRKRSADTTSTAAKRTSNDVQVQQVSGGVTSGICLHVDNKNVSIEYCEKCSEKAYDNFNSEDDQT